MPSLFAVVPGAINITEYELEGGRKQPCYRVRAEYPAQSVLDTIKRRLKERGWSPLLEDDFNPSLPSSHVQGWNYYEDHAARR